jgi:hypothetical protein
VSRTEHTENGQPVRTTEGLVPVEERGLVDATKGLVGTDKGPVQAAPPEVIANLLNPQTPAPAPAESQAAEPSQ